MVVNINGYDKIIALRADGVQIVILDCPEIYAEYEPYNYVDDLKEFIDKVSVLNKTA